VILLDICYRAGDFKTSAPVTSWLVGSIPMHFRHLFDIKGLWGMIGK
jgi:hypothetical protein